MIQAKRACVKERAGWQWWVKSGLALVGLIMLWALVKGTVELSRAYQRLGEAKQALAVEQTKGSVLRRKLENVQTLGYVEKVARDQLNMQKPGETVVIIAKTDQPASAKGSGEVREDKANWEKWWELIK